ncbi:MAG TPA: hypothetical protein IAA06_13845 [Candidatus Blautia faecavium]|uniref:Uncharacterized protein n=1 Tax=Candidatus Blautia faecavium TaxID=2838487 RepID=A0A9D2RXL5_9FIRM|nr:hypothetical protein [Candidatus Blautia faecavium]
MAEYHCQERNLLHGFPCLEPHQREPDESVQSMVQYQADCDKTIEQKELTEFLAVGYLRNT